MCTSDYDNWPVYIYNGNNSQSANHCSVSHSNTTRPVFVGSVVFSCTKMDDSLTNQKSRWVVDYMTYVYSYVFNFKACLFDRDMRCLLTNKLLY